MLIYEHNNHFKSSRSKMTLKMQIYNDFKEHILFLVDTSDINYKNQFMKKKLLLFLLFHLLFGITLRSKNLNDLVKLHNLNFELSSKLISADTIKKNKKTSRNSKTRAILSPPSTTAGSSCGDGVALMLALCLTLNYPSIPSSFLQNQICN